MFSCEDYARPSQRVLWPHRFLECNFCNARLVSPACLAGTPSCQLLWPEFPWGPAQGLEPGIGFHHRPSSCSSGYTLSFMSFKHCKTHQSCYGNTEPLGAPAFTYDISRWCFVSTRGSTPSSWFFPAIAFWALSLTCMNLRKITSSLVWQVSSCKINYPLTSETRCCKGQWAWVCETCHCANLKVVLLSQFFFF